MDASSGRCEMMTLVSGCTSIRVAGAGDVASSGGSQLAPHATSVRMRSALFMGTQRSTGYAERDKRCLLVPASASLTAHAATSHGIHGSSLDVDREVELVGVVSHRPRWSRGPNETMCANRGTGSGTARCGRSRHPAGRRSERRMTKRLLRARVGHRWLSAGVHVRMAEGNLPEHGVTVVVAWRGFVRATGRGGAHDHRRDEQRQPQPRRNTHLSSIAQLDRLLRALGSGLSKAPPTARFRSLRAVRHSWSASSRSELPGRSA